MFKIKIPENTQLKTKTKKKYVGIFISNKLFFSELLCGPKSNHEGRPEYIPKRLQKKWPILYQRSESLLSYPGGLDSRNVFQKKIFFFAMRQNCSDDACAMHACWGRFSKKHRLLIFFRFPARSKSLMYYPTGNKKEIRGFVLDWWLLVITYFWIWKKINRIHYGVQLLCCSGYSPAYHSRPMTACACLFFFCLHKTHTEYWVSSNRLYGRLFCDSN